MLKCHSNSSLYSLRLRIQTWIDILFCPPWQRWVMHFHCGLCPSLPKTPVRVTKRENWKSGHHWSTQDLIHFVCLWILDSEEQEHLPNNDKKVVLETSEKYKIYSEEYSRISIDVWLGQEKHSASLTTYIYLMRILTFQMRPDWDRQYLHALFSNNRRVKIEIAVRDCP